MENKFIGALKIFWMSLWMNFTLLRRYRSNFIFWTAYAVINAAVMLLFVPLYSSSTAAIGTKNIVTFILVGAAMLPLLDETISSVAGNANFQMWSGVINYTFTTPVSRYIYFSLDSISETVISLIIYSPIYIAAVIFGMNSITPLGLVMSIISFAIAFFAMLQLGLMLGTAVLIFRQVQGLEGIIILIVTFLSGAYIPLQVLPHAINFAALFVPLTSSLYLVRYYLIGSALIAPLWIMWVIVIGEMIVFAVVARLMFMVMEKKAERIGFNYI